MISGRYFKEKQNKWIALGFVILMWMGIAIAFDFYYDLNDDVVMKDILSGVYTGQPEGMNIQMLPPISIFISLLYQIVPPLPWYGVFLCLCQFGCIAAIAFRTCELCNILWKKISLVILEGLLLLALFLWELVFVQYTVTVALLAATAIFLFYTTDSNLTPRKFIRKNVLGILLVVLGFCIRMDMMLLSFPFLCVIGLFKWMEESPVFTKENLFKYFTIFGCILSGMGVCLFIQFIAYGGSEWKEFTAFFDARTSVYDFTDYPSFEEGEEFYESIGITKEQYTLIDNYNFGLDESIDTQILNQIAEYQKAVLEETVSLKDSIKQAALDYKYRTLSRTNQGDYPLNIIIIGMYGIILVLGISMRKWNILWQLPLLGVIRSGLWIFTQYRKRTPLRITHSLYFLELVVLFALLLMLFYKSDGKSKVLDGVKKGFAVICLGVSLCFLGSSMQSVQTESVRREDVNQEMTALKKYCKEQENIFYLMDVYSTVAYSEKMFSNVDNSYSNYDIMGGWVNRSPLMYKKYNVFHFTAMEQAIPENNNICVISKLEYPLDWLKSYYSQKGKVVEIEEVDRIKVGEKEVFGVYKVVSLNPKHIR